MTPWTGVQGELYNEAMRVVPALARHRANNSRVDVSATLTVYLRTATELGVQQVIAWAILNSAHMAWVANLFELYANECGVPLDGAIELAVKRAVEWVSDGQ